MKSLHRWGWAVAMVVCLVSGGAAPAQEPLFREQFANVFDPASRTYFSVQSTGGDSFGGQLPYTSVGATRIFGSLDDSVALLTGQMLANYDGSPNGTVGIQQRWMLNLPGINGAILGAGAYVDFTQSRNDNMFQQVGLSLELLTESAWVGRANAYLPIGEIQDLTGSQTRVGGTAGQVSILGTSVGRGGLLYQGMDVALMGTDLEFGRKFFNYRMEAYAGYYNWNGPLMGFTNGVKGGLRGYLTDNLSGNINVAHDEFFGTNLYGGLTYYFGGSGGNRPLAFHNLMTLPAQRSQQVSITTAVRTTSTFVPLVDSSGDPLHIYFVQQSGTGIGTRDNPADVASVLANPDFGAGSVMLLLDANGTLTTPIVLTADRQQVQGGGATGTAVVDFSLALGEPAGTSVVSLTGLGNQPVLAPTSGNGITLTNQNLIQGFTIDGSRGLTNGIAGSPGAANTVVNSMVIQNVAGTGIRIQPSTNTTVTNTTFSGNGQDLLLNAANTTIANVTSTGALNGAINLGGSGGDITGTTTLSNVTITGAGGFGGILLNNAQTGATIDLTNVSITGGSGAGLTVTNSQAGSLYRLTNVDILNVGAAGIGIDSSAGAMQIDATSSVTNTGGAALAVTGGSFGVTSHGTIAQGLNAAAVSVNGHSGTLLFAADSTITTTLGSGLQFTGAQGTYDFLGTLQMTAGDAGIDVASSSGTFTFNQASITNTTGGRGVEILGQGSRPVTTFNGLTITTDGATGFFVDGAGLTTVTGSASVATNGAAALQVNDAELAMSFSSLESSGSSTQGIVLEAASGTLDVTGVTTVNSSGQSGIQLSDSVDLTTTLQSVVLETIGSDLSHSGITLQNAGIFRISGGTINGISGDGIHSQGTNLVLQNLTLGGTAEIAGDGIEIEGGTSSNTIQIVNSTITANSSGISTRDNGSVAELILQLDGNTLTAANSGMRALDLVGSGLNSTIVQSLNGLTVLGGAGGGVRFDRVTFDASGANLAGETVESGPVTIGTTAERVQGDGISFVSTTGSLSIAELNIANHQGTGLGVNTKLLGTTFQLAAQGGAVDTDSGTALILDPLTVDMTLDSVVAAGGDSGVVLDTVSGTLTIGSLTVTNVTANGLLMDGSSAAVTLGSVDIDGAAVGMLLGNNGEGSLAVTGTTTLRNFTQTGIQLKNATGDYSFGDLNIAITGAGTGIDFTDSSVLFQSGNTTITGDGTAGSIAMDLSGSRNPLGLNATASNLQLATGADQTAVISHVGTGIRLGSLTAGSSGAYLVYGNQTPGNSGSEISVIPGGLTLDTANLTSVTGFNQGRYEFLGVEFTGLASFQKSTTLLFVGSSASGLGDGSTPDDRISGADLLALGANPSNFDGKTIVLVNDNAGLGIDLQANSLVLGNNTTLDSFGNGQTFSTGGAVPVNVIVDTIVADIVYTNDNGAATLTNDGTVDLVQLGNGDTIQNVILDGGLNTITGTSINGATIQATQIIGSGVAGIALSETTGVIGINQTSITGTGGDGVYLLNANSVSLNDGTVDGTGGDGIHSINSNLSVASLMIGGSTAVTGDGIEITGTGTSRTVDLSGNTITANSGGIATRDSGIAGELVLILDGNTLQGVNGGALALDVAGSGLNSTIVQSMNGGTVVGNGTNGGVRFNRVTFDGSGADLAGSAVTGGNWTIGTVANRVQGTGLDLQAPTGNLQFGNLNIANNGGTGLAVDAKTLGTTYVLGNTGGTVDTTNGAALSLDPLTTNLSFAAVTSTNSVAEGILLDGVAGTVSLGAVSVTNAAGSGIRMTGSSGAVTADSVTVTGATNGLEFGANLNGSFTVAGATTLSGLSGTGVEMSGASGTYEFADLNVTIAGAQTGLNFTDSNVLFQSGTTSITGDGTEGSIGINLSGSLNPYGANATTSNIHLGTGAVETASIRDVSTGILLGDTTHGSAGAYLVYGNQVTTGSGSLIQATSSGVTLDTTSLTSIDGYTQGRYEFLGVDFEGIASFQKSANMIFAGSTSAGLADGSSIENRFGAAELLNLASTPSNLDGVHLVLVNDNAGAGIDLGANSLTLGANTTVESFGGGNTVSTTGVVPVNVIVNTINGSFEYTDENGAATLTNDGSTNLVTLGDGDSILHVNLSGGTNGVSGTSITGATLEGVDISGASQSGINLATTMGTVSVTDSAIHDVALNGVTLTSVNGLTMSGGQIDGVGGHGIFSNNSNLTVQNVSIGLTDGVGGAGIGILNSTLGHTAQLEGNTIRGTTGGVTVTSTSEGGAGLLLMLNGNSYEATDTGALALDVNANSMNAIVVTSMNGGTVAGNGTGGGVRWRNVRFDGSGALLSGAAVVAGDWTAGTVASRVQGDGMRFDDSAGIVQFGALNIANNAGTGLSVVAKGTSFMLGSTGGDIDTTAGSALFLDPLTADMTFSTVQSTGSLTNGVTLDQVAGSVTIGSLIVDQATGSGLLVNASSATVSITDGSIAGTLGDAFRVSGGNAVVNYGGSIASDAGYVVHVESTTGGSVTLEGPVTADGPSQGIRIVQNTGSVTFNNNVELGQTIALAGEAVTAFNNSGTVSFNTLNAAVETVSAVGAISVSNTSQFNIADGSVSAIGTAALNLSQTTTSITLDSLTASGGTSGLILDLDGGTITSGTTTITGVEQTGVNLRDSAGTISLGALTVDGARVGLDFRNSSVNFTSGTTVITGDGTANSIGINLSGSGNPNGINSTTSNLRIGTGAGQTATLSNFRTGVKLGDATAGSAGAYLVYGNQTPQNSGSSISVISGGLSLDGTHLVSTGPYTQGRYEFVGVSITGATTFPTTPTNYLFVGSVSDGAADGSSPTDRLSVASLLAMTPADLANRYVVLVNDSGSGGGTATLNLGANTLVLGDNTVVDSYGNGNTFYDSAVSLPVNVICDTLVGTELADPFGNGAAVMSNNGTLDVITLNDGNTLQNFEISGGQRGVLGTGVAGVNINHMVIGGSSQSAIQLDSTTGTVSLNSNVITDAGANGIELGGAGTVSIVGGTIDGTSLNGIESTNTNLTVDGVTFGSTSAVQGSGVAVLNTDATNRSVTLKNLVSSEITAIDGFGIGVTSTGTGLLTVELADNQIAAAASAAMIAESSGIPNANTVRVSMTGVNRWESSSGIPALLIQGQNVDADTSSLVVTSIGDMTIVGNDSGGGGAVFDDVTFDSDLLTAGNQQVVAGTLEIGQGVDFAERVVGDGLELRRTAGDLRISSLTVYNFGCEGLLSETIEGSTNFNLDIDAGSIDTYDGAAMVLETHTGNITLNSVRSENSCQDGLFVQSLTGTLNIGSVTVLNSEFSGITIGDSPDLVTTITSATLNGIGTTVDDHGLLLINAGSVTLNGGTIDLTSGSGAVSSDTNLTLSGVTIGGTGVITGAGIVIENTMDAHEVIISNTTITSTDQAIVSTDSGVAGELVLALDGNTLQSTGSSAISITGGALNSTIVRSLAGGTVLGNGTGGGVIFDRVTFDASGAALLATAVTGNDWMIGTTSDRVVGDGLRFNGPSGSLEFSSLNIANTNGTGLYVDAKTLGTTFQLNTSAGSIDTTNGTATFLDPLTVQMTLNSVSSTNSAGHGIWLDGIEGWFRVTGQTTILNAALNGILIENSGGSIQFGDIDINGTGGDGIRESLNTGTIEYLGTVNQQNTNQVP